LFGKVDQLHLPVVFRKTREAIADPNGASFVVEAHLADDAVAGGQRRIVLQRIGAAAYVGRSREKCKTSPVNPSCCSRTAILREPTSIPESVERVPERPHPESNASAAVGNKSLSWNFALISAEGRLSGGV
jgi:hypothetical protein